jgi:tetratricopeptide (TPR) repeat protein
MRWFSVLAIVVVAALVFGTLGIAVFDDLFNGGDGDDQTITVDENEVPQTVQTYLDMLEDDPNDFAAMSALGEYYGQVGDYDQAITWYESALQIVPDDMTIRYAFANTLANAGSQADAELQYQKVIAAEPQNHEAMLSLARLYRNWSPPRTDDAIAIYQQIVDQGGESFVVDLAREELADLSGTPVASPAASPEASPEASPAP